MKHFQKILFGVTAFVIVTGHIQAFATSTSSTPKKTTCQTLSKKTSQKATTNKKKTSTKTSSAPYVPPKELDYFKGNLKIPGATWSLKNDLDWQRAVVKSFGDPKFVDVYAVFKAKNGQIYYLSELLGEHQDETATEHIVISINHKRFSSMDEFQRFFLSIGTATDFDRALTALTGFSF